MNISKIQSLSFLNMALAKRIFFAVLLGINALFTYQFASTFLVGIVTNNGQQTILSPIIAGILAVAVTDAASVIWRYVYIHAEALKQRQYAIIMSMASLVVSSIATFTQIIFNSSALIDLSAYHNFVGVVALFAFGGLIVCHFIAAMQFEVSSNEIREIEIIQGQQALIAEKTFADMEQYIEVIKNQLASGMAYQLRDNMIRKYGYEPDQFLEHVPDKELNKPNAKQMPPAKASPFVLQQPTVKKGFRLRFMVDNEWKLGEQIYNLEDLHNAFEAVALMRSSNPRSNCVVVNEEDVPVDINGKQIVYSVDYSDGQSGVSV